MSPKVALALKRLDAWGDYLAEAHVRAVVPTTMRGGVLFEEWAGAEEFRADVRTLNGALLEVLLSESIDTLRDDKLPVPYPMCSQPTVCAGRGTCPRVPACTE